MPMPRFHGSRALSRPTSRALAFVIALVATLAFAVRSPAEPDATAPVEVDPLDARLEALANNAIEGDATELVNDILNERRGGPSRSWIPALLRAEASPDPQKSGLAAILLSVFEGESLRPDRVQALTQGLHERRVARIPSLSVEILARRPSSEEFAALARGPLEEALRGGDPRARRLAALCLSLRRAGDGAAGADPALLDELLENLRPDRVPRNGLLALDLLSRDSSPEVRARLIGLLDDPDPQTVGMAALALVASGGLVGERLAECLIPNLALPYWGNDAVVMRSVHALEGAPLEEILVPVEVALATAPVPPNRIAELPPLSREDATGHAFNGEYGREFAPDGSLVGDPRVQVGELRSEIEGDRLRRRLARVLFAHPEYRPSPAMFEYLGREMESDDVHRNARGAFDRLEPFREEPETRAFALEGLASEDFQRAWISLRLLGEPPASGPHAAAAAKLLVGALDSSRGHYYRHPYAVEAIGATSMLLARPGIATAELEAALDSPHSDQAWLAAYVLGATGRGARAARIVEILSHPERVVMPEIGGLVGQSARPLLESDPFVKFMVARGLGGLGPEAAPAIRAAAREGYAPYLPIFEILAEYVERPGANPFELESAIALLRSPERLTFRLASVLLAIRNFDEWFNDLEHPIETWSMWAEDAHRPAREAGWSEEMIRAAWEQHDDPFDPFGGF